MVLNVPKGLPPGSDVASMSIFGYDPKSCYSGRGPLEAAAMGLKLADNDVAYRMNLVTIENEVMKDFTAYKPRSNFGATNKAIIKLAQDGFLSVGKTFKNTSIKTKMTIYL